MPTRFLVLRIFIGLLCVGFAYAWGRSIARRNLPHRPRTGPLSWAIRTLLCAIVLLWGSGPDVYAIVAWVAAAISGGAGFFLSRKPPGPEEDLAKKMFGEDD